MRSCRITIAAKNPRMGSRVNSDRVSFAPPLPVSSHAVPKRTRKLISAITQRPDRIGLCRAPAMSGVGSTRKTAGATTAPKKIGGPSASDRAARWTVTTSVSSRESSFTQALLRLRRVLGPNLREESRLVAAVEERLNGTAALRPVALRPRVDVHVHETVGLLARKTTGVAHGVVQRVAAVGQAILDRTRQGARDPADLFGAEVAPHDVAPERKRQARLVLPPAAQVHDLGEAIVTKCQLPL